MYSVYHIPNPNHPDNLSLGYIGVTSRNPEERFLEHLSGNLIVGKAIRKYHIQANDIRVLFEFEDKDEAFGKEKELRPTPKIGWNIGVGGLGGSRGPCSEEAKALMSEKMSGKNNPYYGKSHTDEIRSQISSRLLEKDEEWRKSNASNAGKGNIGKIRSPKSKRNYANAANERPKFTCQYCGKIGQYNSMIAYHGDNCKKRITNNDSGNLLRIDINTE